MKLINFHIRMYSGPATKRPRSAPSNSVTTYHSRSSKSASSSSSMQSSQGSTGLGRAPVNPADKARLAEELRERKYKDKMCRMCSEVNLPIYHHHFSSTDIRRTAMSSSESNKTYMCCVCKDLEPVTIQAAETRKVVLADSSLYGVWDKMPPPKPGTPKLHYEIDTIVGGKVRDMTIALRRNYLHLPNRLEIIVVAGINNIGANDKAENIIEDMKALKKVLEHHSEQWKHDPPSIVSFSTLMYAPKFCSLTVPPSPPEPWVAAWVPPPDFNNRAEEVRKVNDWVIDTQRAEGMGLVRLDYTGIKRFKSGTKQHKFDNKDGATRVWREDEVFRKLHFTMDVKVKTMDHIRTCFISNSQKFGSKSGHH